MRGRRNLGLLRSGRVPQTKNGHKRTMSLVTLAGTRAAKTSSHLISHTPSQPTSRCCRNLERWTVVVHSLTAALLVRPVAAAAVAFADAVAVAAAPPAWNGRPWTPSRSFVCVTSLRYRVKRLLSLSQRYSPLIMITVSRKRTNYRGHAKCTKGNGLCSTCLSVVGCWCVMSTPSLHCAFGTSLLGIDTPE